MVRKVRKRREIAVADERLAGGARLLAIEQRQQLPAAVSAAHAEQTLDGRIAPGLTNRRRPQLRRTGDISLPREYRVVVHRFEAETPDLLDPLVELVAVERAGGRDDGEAIAGARARGFNISRRLPDQGNHENTKNADELFVVLS